MNNEFEKILDSIAAACIANALIEQGVPVLMTNFSKILNSLSGMFSEDRNKYLASFGEFDLLIIDECANIGQIPNLEKLMATTRSREISACLVLQAQSQLKALYKDNADTIIGNCDSMIFLGGKETIDMFNTSDTRGSQRSYGINFQRLGKELLHLMVKSSVAQNKTNRDTIQLDFLQRACKVA